MGVKQCDTTKRSPDTDSPEAEVKWLLVSRWGIEGETVVRYTVGRVAASDTS